VLFNIDSLESLYYSIVPYNYRPGNLWYQFICWLWKRHSTVKPRYLPHTWCDKCVLAPHLMFEVLSKFIEEESIDEIVAWYDIEWSHKIPVNGSLVYIRDEIQDLYDWWHKVYIPYENERYKGGSIWDIWVEPYKPIKYNYGKEGHQFKSPEDEFRYHWGIMFHNDFERYMEVELEHRLHRLVNIIPNLWC